MTIFDPTLGGHIPEPADNSSETHAADFYLFEFYNYTKIHENLSHGNLPNILVELTWNVSLAVNL